MEILIVIMVIVCFVLYELVTMRPLGWHLPHLVNNKDTLCLGDQHWQQAVLVFLDFYFFVFLSLSMCQSVCASVGLFAIDLKFLKTCCEVPSDFWVKKWYKPSEKHWVSEAILMIMTQNWSQGSQIADNKIAIE